MADSGMTRWGGQGDKSQRIKLLDEGTHIALPWTWCKNRFGGSKRWKTKQS